MCTNDSFAMQVSHPVLGGPGLRCAMMLQAHLVRQLIDTAAEQTKLAVDSNMAHSRALSSILVPPFDFGYRVITAPARHANAGAGSLHALAQAVAHVDTPSAMIAGQVSIAILPVPYYGITEIEVGTLYGLCKCTKVL